VLIFFRSNNGHMIKFQLFDSADSYQCHFAEISTFVVSIAHYMRAYFNYEALTQGKDFTLPDDAAYLNVSVSSRLGIMILLSLFLYSSQRFNLIRFIECLFSVH
jgi:hypothetical protein